MPTIKSAKKRIKTAAKKKKVNQKWKIKLKDALSEMENVIAEGSKEEAEEKLQETYKIIDQAASKDLIHKNNAARKKSKYAKQVENMDK